MRNTSDEDLVREALALVSAIDSNTLAADRIGVSESTIRRWRGGEVSTPLRKGTRIPLERFVASGGASRPSGAVAGPSDSTVAHPTTSEYVAIDGAGQLVLDEIDQLMEWLPEGMSRRFVRHVSRRVRLGELYAYGIEQGWSKERLDRIDAARKALDELRERDDPEAGGSGG